MSWIMPQRHKSTGQTYTLLATFIPPHKCISRHTRQQSTRVFGNRLSKKPSAIVHMQTLVSQSLNVKGALVRASRFFVWDMFCGNTCTRCGEMCIVCEIYVFVLKNLTMLAQWRKMELELCAESHSHKCVHRAQQAIDKYR